MSDAAEFRTGVRAALADVTEPRDALRRLGAGGFLARCVLPAERRDGRALPLDFPAFAVLVEELSRGDFGIALAVGVHTAMFVPLVARHGGATLRDVTDAAVRGELLGAVAMTDAGAAGSDVLAMTTSVCADGDELVVTGHKTYVANVPAADAAVVFAAREGAASFARISALLVRTDAPGVRAVPRRLGVMTTAAVGDLHLDAVRVPAGHLLGRTGRGLHHFLEHVAVERLMGGIWASAVAERCLLAAQQAAAGRQVGGAPLWRNAAVRQRLAGLAVRTTLFDAAVQRTLAGATETGLVDQIQAAALKAAAAPLLADVVGTCLQFEGAQGLEADSPLLRMLVDARAFGVAGGTTETMLEMVADDLESRAAAAARTP